MDKNFIETIFLDFIQGENEYFDSFLESILETAFINDNANEKDKQIIKMFIENEKKINLGMLKVNFF